MVSCIAPKNRKPEIARAKQEAMAHIRFLASDELKGRKPGTPEMKIAARYLVEQFRSFGLQSFSTTNEYFQAVPVELLTSTSKKTVSCNNVVGYIEGSDSILKKEYMVLMAHYDHLGVIPDTVNAQSDSIYNGARDNGMGITALLCAAKKFSKNKPLRSVIFLATTGEEEGMQGSDFFIKKCPVPVNSIFFVLNNDGGGYNDTTLIRIGGINEINFSANPWKNKIGSGINCLPYPEELQYLFKEGDAIIFSEMGIPSITISPGFDKIDEAILKYIHKPTDEAGDDFNYSYLAKFCLAYYEMSCSIANSGKLPSWKKGSLYYSKGIELYGK
ncbi:MAG: hypothetical protein A2W85_13755 [Bacteroidetes bacterium GWF2_41_31]|nr:MAG: hypothetical protein A2W85_13755 [Bacteroidetes bacterium GWF2_41_31]OFZ05397.1 MAG: hypothetical protein A2338_08610 [Bacteroidetes bacterium RIFOXYB12_FULL_41_6]